MSFLPRLWKDQPGKFFCISTKSHAGSWKDHYFEKADFGDIREFLSEHKDTHDLYFCPHGFNTRNRDKDAAVLGNWYYADLDFSNPDKFDRAWPKPTIALESSPGRFVALWRCETTIKQPINRGLTYLVGADKGGWGPGKVLRIPNTYNYKYKDRPKVRILWDDGPAYTETKITKALPLADDDVDVSGKSANQIYKQFANKLSPANRRLYLAKNTGSSDRSTILHRLAHAFLEAGAEEAEVITVLKSCVWNKFKTRSNEMKHLEREVQKAMDSHFERDNSAQDGKAKFLKVRGEKPNDEEEEVDVMKKWFGKSLAELEDKEFDWIWWPFLARGEVTIMEGPPGVGKSFLTQIICGRVCDGKKIKSPMPSGLAPVQGKVAYFDMENSADKVTKPRLALSGVEHLENFYQVEAFFSIHDDEVVSEIYQAIGMLKPAVIVFDTLNSYLGGADTNHGSQAQQALNQFKMIAREFDCAVIVIRHLKKNRAGVAAVDMGAGSASIAGVARNVLTVVRHPEVEDFPGWNVMFCSKANNGPEFPDMGLTFQIQGLSGNRLKSKLVLGSWEKMDRDDVLSAPPPTKETRKGKRDEGSGAGAARLAAEAIILEKLKDGGEVAKGDIERAAAKKSVSVSDLKMAAQNMGVVMRKGMWRLETK